MTTVDVTRIAIAIRTVRSIKEDHHRALDVKPYASFDQFRSAARAAESALREFGFTIRDDWRGAALSFGGIRSTSTGGIGGAMSNWLRAAEARVGDAK